MVPGKAKTLSQPALPVTSACSVTKLDDFSEQLGEHFKTVEDEPIEADSTRVDQLELRAQQQEISSWCQTAADQIKTVATQVQAQDTKLTAVCDQLQTTTRRQLISWAASLEFWRHPSVMMSMQPLTSKLQALKPF